MAYRNRLFCCHCGGEKIVLELADLLSRFSRQTMRLRLTGFFEPASQLALGVLE